MLSYPEIVVVLAYENSIPKLYISEKFAEFLVNRNTERRAAPLSVR